MLLQKIVGFGKDHSSTTDDLGQAEKKPIPFRVYDLKCIVAGYKPFERKKYKMVRGKAGGGGAGEAT
ncbi:MAG: hypothetical protein HY842_03655 [Bacteroidetes bacterium]|nr:hypothetical protein [Bacteroidota bacterium]